jgi:hypothetical protein
MSGLFHAHSGIRFLILLFGAVNVVVLGLGIAQKKPFEKIHRVLGSIFTGSLHLQVVLGLAMVAMGRYFPALIGHMAMMILAAVIAQATSSINRRSKNPNLVLPLLGVVVALLCITGGLMAIGRGLFTVSGS